jgi:uncharacterized protein (DUF433 family)
MVDIYTEPLLNVQEAARYLAMPQPTLATWRRDDTIHSRPPQHRGWPSLPFAAVVEAFVLRSLRDVFPMTRIREAAAGVRHEFNDDYGLVRPNIGHDGAEIFIKVAEDYFRARDRQQAIRETVSNFKEFIVWDGQDPKQLRLRQFNGEVLLDPRFGWGTPVVASNMVPLDAILGLWRAREPIAVIAEEFGMGRDDVERIIQSYDVGRDAA